MNSANSNLSYSTVTVPFAEMNKLCFGNKRVVYLAATLASQASGIITDSNFTGENGGVVAEASEDLQIFFIQLLNNRF